MYELGLDEENEKEKKEKWELLVLVSVKKKTHCKSFSATHALLSATRSLNIRKFSTENLL